MGINPVIFNIGSDRCQALAHMAREREHEVMLCDNLALPFRDSSMDAVLSIAVIHHIATAERRVHALRELSRVLRVGGRVMISVWAMEQRHRKFESQDVLIPWHKPPSRVGSIASKDITTTTSEDDVTHYHAYTQTSDSDQKQANASRLKLTGFRRKHLHHHRKAGRSFDPSAGDILDGGPGFRPPYQSSSELSSPSNETCYSFVRKALQKFSAHQQRPPAIGGLSHSDILSDDGRSSARFQWFRLAGLEKMASLQPHLDEDLDKLDSASVLQIQASNKIFRVDSGDSNHSSVGDLPIELPHLEEEDDLYNVFKSEKLPEKSRLGRSRSLDDMQMMLTKSELKHKRIRMSLRETRRAFTVDDDDHTSKTGPELKVEVDLPKQKRLLKDIKSTLSASLKSIDVSIRSGSITSISSGKSLISNFSVKSDSGISLPAPKPAHVQELPNLQEEMCRFRNWDSEPTLDKKSRRSKKDLCERSQSSMGEKEKSRAMQSVESKLMKAIKEVNESDISENSTPLNSPGPALLIAQQKSKIKSSTEFPFQDRKMHVVEANIEASNGKHANEMEVETFDELKTKIKAMPKFRPFHSTTNMGGSMDRGKEPGEKKAGGWGKQMSLHDELLSHERLTANEEMRRKIQKQQSLPDNAPKRHRSLKEGLMEVVSKSKQFESLKQSLVMLRNNASTVVEEKEENLTPLSKECGISEPFEKQPSSSEPRHNKPNGSNQAPQITGQAIKSGIVRIWQSWRSTDRTEGPSFTHKRGVSIQPIEVRSGRGEPFKEGGAACRRSLFQRRRGGSSPLSPQQLEALAREDSMSPTSFRRCCMDCPGGDIVIVDQAGNIRERKLSRGGETSDSSSKDGSIQSDTSLDSEDSCVSVIFVPHPDGKFGLTGEPVPELITKPIGPRKQSNSSESSESTQSGRTSPIQSPGLRLQISPTKTKLTKIELFRQSVGTFETYVSRNVSEDGSETVYCLTDRTLEKIDERHTESESEAEREALASVVIPPTKQEEPPEQLGMMMVPPSTVLEPIKENVSGEQQENPKVDEETKSPIKLLQRRLSSHKSFEMEDIPKEPPKVKRRLKSSKERQRATRSLIPKPKYDYPIVRHHPLFAKQTKPGDPKSNFTSLLMGQNVRIIRGQSLSSNESMDERFDIFNPELDDSDSDNDHESLSDDSSSSSIGSNDSVESVVSASKANESSLKDDLTSKRPESAEDLEISRRAEKRRQSLMSLLDENHSVICNINEKRRQLSLSGSSSTSSLNRGCSNPPKSEDAALLAAQRATGAIPKKPLPAIIEPKSERLKKMAKAKSVTTPIAEKDKSVKRQLSIPVTLEHYTQSSKLDDNRKHLSPGSNSDASGILVKGSHESLADSTDSAMSDRKTPSPSRSKSSSTLPKRLTNEEQPEPDTEVPTQPIVQRRIMRKNRDDSTDSNAPSAKNSVQYSDTSSLLSHRFSTISISSNVSSSDVSISASGGHSGSSCYLASMSSTDFDDRPVLASSFSLSEAEIDTDKAVLSAAKPKLKHLLKEKLPSTTEEETIKLNEYPRSRIGTETSVETSIENPTCIQGESFEEELAHAFSKDDDEVLIETNSKERTSLSAASSSDSLHSDSGGGNQTYHRYYHVFKEGELDYLINTYVDSLHIINSYYDHANWCIVAEKVNVWTI